jgi:NADH-quinone oxidoreductase subunit N
VIILVVTIAVGLFYYLRLVAAMYMQPPQEEVSVVASSLSLAGSLVLAALMLLLVWLGVYPAPFIDMIQATAARLI